MPTINGAVCLFDDQTGTTDAPIDFRLVTKWKTAGDNLLGALCLARPESQTIPIIGAGTVGSSSIEAFSARFPGARFTIWNRTQAKAETLSANRANAKAAPNLEEAMAEADIVLNATMATEPLLKGAWLRPGNMST